MKQRGKIFATLLVFALCIGANLYAERARHVGVNNNGDLDLTLLQQLGITPGWEPLRLDLANRTINGEAIIPTGSRSARTESGLNVRFEHLGDSTRLHVGDRNVLTYANGNVPIGEPDVYRDLGAQTLSFEDPITGMPMTANGLVRIRDFTEDPTSPQEATVRGSEFDIRLQRYQEGMARLRNSGIESSVIDVGGVEFELFANGVVLLDPELPMRLTQMDPGVLNELNGVQLPVAVPQFVFDNDRLLFANGSLRRNLPE